MRRFSAVITSLVLLAVLSAGCIYGDDAVPRAEKGILDISHLDLGESGPVSLDGEWAFFWDVIVNPETGTLPMGSLPDQYVEVPSYWDHLSGLDDRITPRGQATYSLKIFLPVEDQSLALKFRNVTPNAVIYVNGLCQAELGVVSSDPAVSESGNRALVIPLSCTGPEITLLVSISNYHNINGGLNRSVDIGLFEDIRQSREEKLGLDALFLGGLLLMGLYQLALFVLQPKRRAALFMAALCLLAFFFAGFKNEMVLLTLFPAWDGEVRTKFIFLALALAPAGFTWYAYSLYPGHFNKWGNRVIGGVALVLSVVILLTPKAFYTRLLPAQEAVLAVAAIYNIFMLVRGYVRSRDGLILLYLGGIIFLLASILVGIVDNALTDVFRSISGIFFVFILYQAFLQAFIFSHAFREIDSLSTQKAKLEKRNVELFSLTYIDSLTGTCNRRLFDDFLASNWRVSALSGKSLGMILLDIDEFKDYNEFYGHRKGDVCLTRVCEIVRENMNVQGQDTLARYGGEEFAIIVSDISGGELYEMAEKIREAVEDGNIEHQSSSTSSVITISLGCAVLTPTMDADPETLIDAADVALHQAKTEGRNRTILKGAGGQSWKPRLV